MTKNDSSTRIDASFNGLFDGGGHTVTIYADRHCSTGNYGDGQSVGLIGRLGLHDNDTTARPTNAAVRNVVVQGKVYANRSVGGVVGKIGKTNGGGTIENCANFAAVSATDAKGVGGIVGSAWNTGSISNCYNAGTINGTHPAPVGGIAGSVEVKLTNCFNVGKVTGVSGYAMAIGTNNASASYTNCFYLENSAADGGWNLGSPGSVNNDGVRAGSYMKSDEFLNDVGSAFAKDTNNINGGYPVLTFQNPTAQRGDQSLSAESSGSGSKDDSKEAETTIDLSVIKIVVIKDVSKLEWNSPFADVSESNWYFDAVRFVSINKLMNGVGNGEFAPNVKLTRAMLVTILARLSAVDTSLDIYAPQEANGGKWYSAAMAWAKETGITDGSDPERVITRDELATMLYRFTRVGKDGYGGEALAWAKELKLIQGDPDGSIREKDTATRAEVAVILTRFLMM
jgi:hypothetical protein